MILLVRDLKQPLCWLIYSMFIVTINSMMTPSISSHINSNYVESCNYSASASSLSSSSSPSSIHYLPCPPSKFRSFNGECNNILHKTWGSSGDIFLRLLEPEYANGHSQPRTSRNSTENLPNTDYLVNILQDQTDPKLEHMHVSALLPIWAQFLSNDLLEIKESKNLLECCQNSKNLNRNKGDETSSSSSSSSTTSRTSFNNYDGRSVRSNYDTNRQIKNDNKTTDNECYVELGDNCKNYKRSVTKIDVENCVNARREQMNSATAYLDGSSLYGTNDDDLRRIRTFANGKVDIKLCRKCDMPGPLGGLHMMLLKEHNRVAEILRNLNPLWNDEKLFFEARQILIAQIQHITFNEFLSIVLGEQNTNNDGLRLIPGKYFHGYSTTHRAGTFNEFAVTAFPAFSTMLSVEMINQSYPVGAVIDLPAQYRSYSFSSMYKKEWSEIGLAIHRARDHGIPSYVKALNLCGTRNIPFPSSDLTFELLMYLNIPEEHMTLLKSIYKNVNDIDLLVGGLLEEPSVGAIFGPTISCLIALQFSYLRSSDRFWYENDIPPSSFRMDQLQSIRKTSLASLLCRTFEVFRIQPKAFILEDAYLNAKLSCDQIPGIDLAPWQEYKETDKEANIDRKDVRVDSIVEDLHPELIKEAVEKAKENHMARKKFEYEAWLSQGGIDAQSPDGTAASFSKANKNALSIANTSLIFEYVSNEILNTLHKINRRKRQVFDNNLGIFARDDFADTLQAIDVTSLVAGTLSGFDLDGNCEDYTGICDPSSPFRTHSGHCNNLRNPSWGRSLTTFTRLLPAQYEDGVSRPRQTSVTGLQLPNPRVVSTLIHPDISNLHTRYSLMIMQYAQFLDHDLTMTPIHKGFHESIPSCRKCDSPQTVHPECNPFPVPAGDHYYPEINVTSGERLCFPFMRSLPGQQALGPRDQINQNTAFLDGSQIYGENRCVSNKLRGFSGRLNSTTHPIKGKELLPQSPHHPECKSRSGLCFIAGDGRASEQPGLTSVHTIFLREHNRIVEGLRGVNPHWNGDQLYEHARRIVIAQNQYITYNEFLPRILSWNAVNLYGLKLLSQGYYKDYNPTCSPAIFNEFAAAAFRVGHSLLRPHIPRLSVNHQPIDPPLLLRDGFFRMDALVQPGILDEIMRGLVATPMESLDQFITGEVTNHLFEDRRIPFSGVDLIALNIQRGRDHGVPSYNNYRALCNLKRAQTWQDLSREIPSEVIARFKKIYPTVDDIDLFPGAMTERPLQGGLAGPTLACIIGIQFRQLRKCDRFWFENGDPDIRFTENQLAEIRKTTLAKIICENLEVSGDMQRAVFDLPSNFLNPRVPCHSMPQIDLSAWRENIQGCQIANRQVRIGESAFPSPCTSCVCTLEGPQCASLRITDCAQLAREWSREAILRDDVCSSQCGLILKGGSSSSSSPFSSIPRLSPPPSRISRSRPSNVFDFKFPDLTPFITSL